MKVGEISIKDNINPKKNDAKQLVCLKANLCFEDGDKFEEIDLALTVREFWIAVNRADRNTEDFESGSFVAKLKDKFKRLF